VTANFNIIGIQIRNLLVFKYILNGDFIELFHLLCEAIFLFRITTKDKYYWKEAISRLISHGITGTLNEVFGYP